MNTSENRFRRPSTPYESLAGMFAGDALMVDAEGRITHVFGDAGRLLETPKGPMTTSVTALCRSPWDTLVGALITQATATSERAEHDGDGQRRPRRDARRAHLRQG